MKTSLLSICALMVVSTGCYEPLDSAADVSALEAQLDEIEKLTTPDSEMYLSYFAPEAVLLPPDEGAIEGRDAALAFYQSAFEGVTALRLQYSEPIIEVSGDLAVRRYAGSADITFGESAATTTAKTKYLDVLKRQPDGTWMIVTHSWGADP